MSARITPVAAVANGKPRQGQSKHLVILMAQAFQIDFGGRCLPKKACPNPPHKQALSFLSAVALKEPHGVSSSGVIFSDLLDFQPL